MQNSFRSTSRVRLVRCTMLLALAACSSTPAVPYRSDVVPGFDPASLACVVLLSRDEPGIGTGILIGTNRLLTARHVVDMLRGLATGPFRVRINAGWTTARVLAQGEMHAPHGDWALLEVEGVAWPTERLATLHAPALAADWSPPEGTEVVMAGYAGNFFVGKSVDPRVPAPILATRTLGVDANPEDAGRAWFAASRWHDLSGMSGGAVFLRPGPTGQPELIGVFTGATQNETALEGPFGIRFGLDKAVAERFVRLPAAALMR